MLLTKALKYPVLIIGIVLFTIYLTDPKTSDFWQKYNRRFIPSTCDALKDRLDSKVPENWLMKCPGTQLMIVTIEYENDQDKLPDTRIKMYKLLANSLVIMSSKANPETMENLLNLKFIINHDRLSIIGKTDGQAVFDLRNKKLKKDIAEHLKLTVKVKEISH